MANTTTRHTSLLIKLQTNPEQSRALLPSLVFSASQVW